MVLLRLGYVLGYYLGLELGHNIGLAKLLLLLLNELGVYPDHLGR